MSTISPQGSRAGQTRLSQQGQLTPRDRHRPGCFKSAVSNSCLGSKSQSSQEECELGAVEADPKGVCAGDPACLNSQSVRCDYGFPSPGMSELQWGPAGPGQARPHQEVTGVSCQELGKYLLLKTSLQC